MQPAISLSSFFERAFVPHKLATQPERARFYREAIDWLERTLGRPASLGDVDNDNVATVVDAIVAQGFTRLRARHIAKYLRALRRHAARLGLVESVSYARGAPSEAQAPARPPSPTWLEAPPGPDTLAAACAGMGAKRDYPAACAQFDRFLNRYANSADVTADNLAAFRRELLARGRSEALADMYATRLRALARSLDPAAFPSRRECRLPEPPPAGSVRAFFHETYRAERMVRGYNLRDYRTLLRLLFEFRGRDVQVAELTDSLAAEFFTWLLEVRGLRAVTVNSNRGRLFAIWRLAVERGLLNRDPRVRKLRESRDAPDSWTPEQVRWIIEAPLTIEWPRPIAGIPAGPYYRALLLVTYWTGFRRGTLLKIPCDAIDLESGWLTIGGWAMKDGDGLHKRLGPDAIAAIRAIWEPQRELLFPFPHSDSAFAAHIRRIMRASGVPKSTRVCATQLHKMRRTVATIVAAKRGIDAAAEMLGHSTTDVTKRYIDPSKLPGCDATEFLPVVTGSTGLATNDKDQSGAPNPRDLLRNAIRIFDAGDTLFAAAGCRIALERWLRDRGHALACLPPDRGSGLLARARVLVEAGHLAHDEFYEIRKLNKLANRSAHGCHVARERVVEMFATLERLFQPK